MRFSQFNDFYLKEDLSDITIVINGHKIPSHKIILSSRSLVFRNMFLSQFKESTEKEIQIKDTNIEAFKLFLKYCYFNELDSNEIKDYSMAFDVFKLSHRYQIQELSHFIEEKLIEMIAVENVFIFFDLGLFYQLIQLLNSLKSFMNQNITEIIEQKLFLNYSFELIDKFSEFVNISQNDLITVFTQISTNNSDKDLKQFRKLIKFGLCSIQDINRLRNIRIFDDKELNEVIEKRFEDLIKSNEELTQRNARHQKLVDDYKKAKEFFQPFIDSKDVVIVNGIQYSRFGSVISDRNFNFKF